MFDQEIRWVFVWLPDGSFKVFPAFMGDIADYYARAMSFIRRGRVHIWSAYGTIWSYFCGHREWDYEVWLTDWEDEDEVKEISVFDQYIGHASTQQFRAGYFA